ncbi:MAG: A/G-specific adenine glycosylase [Desulfurococcaceae archaeon]|jgi:A/G-specific adenine glycosylase|nr:A/G-specific adenine glycosylase [Desulfurococcaceae archaeon]
MVVEYSGRLEFLRRSLMEWFRRSGRKFPWRGEVGWYGILLAEFLLVRTRSEVAERAFHELLSRFPTPENLCSAGVVPVREIFERIGLPSRAERLVTTVCTILREYGGRIPCDYQELLKLPGVGDYIARVVLSRVCGKHVAFVDSNVLRILTRFLGARLSVTKAAELLERYIPKGELLYVNVALLDLGALVCKPRKALCYICPLTPRCSTSSGTGSSLSRSETLRLRVVLK